MFPFSHMFGSFAVILGLSTAGVVELTGLTVVLSAVISVMPDADAIWKEELLDHHNSLLHTPLFWLTVSLMTGIFLKWSYGALIFSGAFFHLFTDYVTGRTIGVNFFFPFGGSYSLYPLESDTGNFDPIRPDREKLKKHLSNYLNNKPQLLFELAVNAIGVLSLLIVVSML